MSSFPDNSRQDRSGSLASEDPPAEELTGWEQPCGYDLYLQNRDRDGKIKLQIIRKANSLIRLSSVIFKQNINFEHIDTPSGWTHKSRCPFPDHNDGSPSFGYNSKDDRFNCFGCGRGGGSVQFLAALQQRPQLEIAKELLSRQLEYEDVISEIEDKTFDKTEALLTQFSTAIQQFLIAQSDKNKALQFVEKLTWNVDLYIAKHVMKGTVDVDNLAFRLDSLLQKLKEYR